MSIEGRRAETSWRLRIPLIIGALAGAGALTQVGLPGDAQAFAHAARVNSPDGRDSTVPTVRNTTVLTARERAGVSALDLVTDSAATTVADPVSDPVATPPASTEPKADEISRLLHRRTADSGASGDKSDALRQSVSQQAIAEHIARTWRVEVDDVRRYVSLAWKSAGAHDLDPVLVLAIIATESSFDPKARSKAGAEGLMQVHTRVHKDKFARHGGSRAAFDPAINIQVGTLILKRYLDRYGRTQRALKAYVGAADLAHDNGYASKVLARRAEFRDVIRGGESAAREREAGETRAAEEAAMLTSGMRAPKS